ncbi:hypothetical protein MMC07_008441 [Pseudocyphellaria aurata]|nr:hypothetical protein [Pseudocyphellaria aurata]
MHWHRLGDWGEVKASHDALWQAMNLLTNVKEVDIGFKREHLSPVSIQNGPFPSDLFRFVTSVSLVGLMQHSLATTILSNVSPATLKHLCFDMLQVFKDRTGDSHQIRLGGIIDYSATLGLLTPLKNRCTALRSLTLRRIGHYVKRPGNEAAHDAYYAEWGSFIRSVQATVENFTFEQAPSVQFLPESSGGSSSQALPFRYMDDKFCRFVLPAIVEENWPCLATLELLGVRGSKLQGGTAGLETLLRTALGEKPRIVVQEIAFYVANM